MSAGPVPIVGLDHVEAAELSELLEFTAQWLTHAGPAVAASVDARVGGEGYSFELRDELVRWSQLLLTRGPRP